MKTISIRLPERLAAEIEAESRERRISKSDVVRERLQRASPPKTASHVDDIADLIGSVVDDLPADLSERKKHYLQVTGYGRKRAGRRGISGGTAPAGRQASKMGR